MIGTPEFRVGLFVLLGLFMVAAFSFKFNTDPNVGGRVKRYELVLPNATGLAKGAKISIAGIPVGVIEDIKLDDGKARLNLSMRAELPVTKSASVEVKSEGILGDKRLELFVGNPNDPALPEGSLFSDALAAMIRSWSGRSQRPRRANRLRRMSATSVPAVPR